MNTPDLNALYAAAQSSKQGQKKTYEKDANLWSPKRGDDGKAQCIVRLVHDGLDELPWLKMIKHNFTNYVDGKKRGLYELSPMTLTGKWEDDPVLVYRYELYKKDKEGTKAFRKKMNPREFMRVKVYIVKDEHAPENQGKVMFWNMPMSSVFEDVIVKRMVPFEVEGEDTIPAINGFDMVGGANLILEIWTKGEGDLAFPQYDKCRYGSIKPIGDKAYIDSILEESRKIGPLSQYIDGDKIMSYEKMEEKLQWVLGMEPKRGKPSSDGGDDSGDDSNTKPKSQAGDADDIPDSLFDKSAPKSTPAVDPSFLAAAKTAAAPAGAGAGEDDDDDAAYFKKLASS